MASRIEAIRERLMQLIKVSPEIEGCALISSDGFMLVNLLPPGMITLSDEDIAAMCASLLSIGEKIVKDMKKGVFERQIIMGKQGYTIIMDAGPDAILMVLARKSEKDRLGLIYLEAGRAARDVAEMIG